MSTLLQRGWRRLGYAAVQLRDRGMVDTEALDAGRISGRWRWVQELPPGRRQEFRANHLATVCTALEGAGIDHFVVPDPVGHRPQVGVVADRMRPATAAISAATQAWYTARGTEERLLARTSGSAPFITYPRYRVHGTQYVTGVDLGIAVVPWRPTEGGYEPAARNAYVSFLRDEDLEARAPVHAHGRSWSSLAVFAAPHPEAVRPLRWLVIVPVAMRQERPELADLLGRYAARSIWFHSPIGSSITLLDTHRPRWLRDEQAVSLGPASDGDALAWLVAAWTQGDGPVGVLPAGGVLVGDLSPRRLINPAGLGLFRPDPAPLDVRPPVWDPDQLAEARALRGWFHERTGAWMPHAISALPTGFPAPDTALVDELATLVDDPTRPPVTSGETAVTVVAWLAYLRARALRGSLRAARHRAGTDRFRAGMASLATSSRRTEAVSVEPRSLLEVDDAVDHFTRMATNRLPRPAPWE